MNQEFIIHWIDLDAIGRMLVVVHTPRGNKTRLISARKASKYEIDNYYA